ncbi:MAG TPA: prolyl oligopeptidase family serine peptidase [Fimbriimonas sp.]
MRAALPDPLRFADGSRVRGTADWERRRLEIQGLFETHVYGAVPSGSVQSRVEVLEAAGSVVTGSTQKRVRIALDGPAGSSTIDVALFVPQVESPPPVFLLLNNREPACAQAATAGDAFWPVERILQRGYATAAIDLLQVAPDRPDAFSQGVFRLFGGARTDGSWGVIAAWAWGARRAADYLCSESAVDGSRLAVVGHSRGGKTALWAGANDSRFGIVVSNESGSTGAAVARDKRGERIADINRTFPHWFCSNYRRYDGREHELPVDQHELLALVAPRPIYVASAAEDEWADPESEFRACVEAEPVYRLLGRAGLESSDFPAVGRPLHGGAIAYHVRSGGHDLLESDWTHFLDYADLRWRRSGTP